ncbi:MAG: hypothetical protein OEU54_09940, partial [Gemmatimonadota bacterium]|nr:hypothetical protein [Gemmatimonadota bacterium]
GDWREVTDAILAAGVPSGGYVSRVIPSSHDANRFYVTVDHHRTNDFNPYVAVTEDGGRSFRSIASNLPTGSVDFVHVIAEDPRNENLLFVGTDVGAYASADRGGSWERLMSGIGHAVPIHDLKIHPRDRELMAATHGRSLWIMNIAPLQDLTADVMAAGAAFFEPAPAFQFGQRVEGGESYGHAWFQRPTPGSAATLAYYLDDEAFRAVRQTAWDRQGDAPTRPRPQIKIAIANEAGEVVRTLTANASSGLNHVSWDLRGERPAADELSPSRRVERERLMERAEAVRDSLGQEEDWEADTVQRLTGLFTGETDAMQMFQAFLGGGGGGGDPERFRPRPGESPPGGGGGGFGGFGEMQTIAELMNPGEGLRSLFRFFQGGNLQAPMVEPGTYTLTMTAEDRAFDPVRIEVGRVGEYQGRNAPFAVEIRRALRGTSR